MGRRRFFKNYRYNRMLERFVAVLFQILLPLIIFQFIRTILLPTKFDMILLGILVVLYLSQFADWSSKKK
ncbi:MAG: hypothetical protein LRY73_05280 [Bacillus sp. (in: Bacteria)]|nr:hypothetical protein [Bacillus sp. (in: firmicutes)]